MVDARQQRTRERLREAILALGTRGPVSGITMAELAGTAGVNRSTVYEHTTSPQALLEQVLLDELDRVRERHLVGLTPELAGAASRAVMIDVLAHVDDHAEIYRRGLGDASRPGPLLAVLAGHFRESVRLILAGGAVRPPPGAPPAETIARFIGDGAAGAVTSWLDGDGGRDPEEFADAYGTLVPTWWLGA
ncbi:TetR/AcrR family transcriptional regulator [Nakamurella sp. YIM 132087]|uniref:TetR/AcrR family transcriptional regulator n=1 Tax=Nakamurella alba TaxID=2665158 RepID=A0A7K1FJI7_9ACTN|nr:TetR/AcrR family transcriptional regulator [Nakamurella alba]MTD14291.1 TetR/AcrR family transcriptional regulator [Nakamurella alba]